MVLSLKILVKSCNYWEKFLVCMFEQTINHFQSWREAQNLVYGENMYALGLPISVHSTAPEGPNMSIPSVVAMRTGQCSVLGQKTVGIRDQEGSQESDNMKYVAIIWHYGSLRQTYRYGADVRDITGDCRHYTALHRIDASETQEYSWLTFIHYKL